MSNGRRLVAVLSLLVATALVASSPASAADDLPGGDDNAAVAVNTEDGGTVFRLAFSIRQVANGVIDETNSAYALASCNDCQTVALAFQVVLVWGGAQVVVPENTAVAYNEQCTECVTYASATQIVLGFDGPVRFTDEGRRRLAALYKALRDLEGEDLTLAQLHAAVTAAKGELLSILDEELVEAPAGATDGSTTPTTGPPDGGTAPSTTLDQSTTSTASSNGTGASTTTTTAAGGTGTSTTLATSTNSTSTTTEPNTTTTSAAPTTTAAG